MLILLTVQETADLIGRKFAYPMKLAKKGDFPKPVKVPGRRVRTYFDQHEIYEWMIARALNATAAAPLKSPGDRRRGWPSVARRMSEEGQHHG